MKKASGAVFFCKKTKRVCLLLRSGLVSNPGVWGFAGGKIESGETILNGLSREIREEIGFIPKYDAIYPIDVFRSTDREFLYYSVLVVVDKEFIPRINHESGGWGWFDLNSLPKPLHPGVKAVLLHEKIKEKLDSLVV